MRNVVVCGKGGIGKSTLVTNLAVLGVLRGHKVLQVGCDPKHDSCARHLDHRLPTVMDTFKTRGGIDRDVISSLIERGRTGVWCVEAGGPQPGEGCAGRAVSLFMEFMRDAGDLFDDYDVALYDLLGDVVCGGFAAPIRRGRDTAVYLVVSGEILPIYAANNIAAGVVNLARRGGGRVGGVIANLRGTPGEREVIERFATGIGTRVVGWIPRDPCVFEAESRGRTLIELFPKSPAAVALGELAAKLYEARAEDLVLPTPLTDDQFEAMFARPRPADAP